MLRSEVVRKVVLSIMSIFIVWHLVAILIVGPSHKSYLRSSLIDIYQDYLWFLKIDSAWSFYAPNPPFGSMMRYDTLNASGERNIYPLTEVKAKFDHAYVRNVNFYLYFFYQPDYTIQRGYDKSVARYLCAQHVDSNTTAIIFRRYQQQRFTYQDHLLGKQALDKEFLKYRDFGPYSCGKSENE